MEVPHSDVSFYIIWYCLAQIQKRGFRTWRVLVACQRCKKPLLERLPVVLRFGSAQDPRKMLVGSARTRGRACSHKLTIFLTKFRSSPLFYLFQVDAINCSTRCKEFLVDLPPYHPIIMLFTSIAFAALLASCEAKIGNRKLSFTKMHTFTPQTQVTDHVSHDSAVLLFHQSFPI